VTKLKRICISVIVLLLIISTIILLTTVISVEHDLPIPRISEISPLEETWPMFRHDSRHTGYSSSKSPDTNHTMWTSENVEGYLVSSPTIVDGKVFVGGTPGGSSSVYCFNETTGELVWKSVGEGTNSSACVVNGKVFIGSYSGNVYCLNASNGDKIWNLNIGGMIEASPTVVDGKVFIGSQKHETAPYFYETTNYFYCLNESSADIIWKFEADGSGQGLASSPAVADGRVFIGFDDGNIYCFNESTGASLWNHTTGNVVFSSPTVVDGKVFVGSGDGNIYCLEELTGALVWNYTTGGLVDSSTAVAGGRVFVGSWDKNVYALNATNGNLIWNYKTGDMIHRSSPALADGKVFIGSFDGNIYCLNQLNGQLIWKYTFERRYPDVPLNPVISSPAVANGKVFVSSFAGKLYAFFGVRTSISIDISASSTYVGFKVNISGTLSDLEGRPLGDSIIVLSYIVPGVPTWSTITSVNTEPEGDYFAVWIPTATGSFTIRAEWAGNATYVGTYNVKNLEIISHADRYVFSIESNSTLSSLFFNSSANEFSFSVSGPSGTSGYVRVFISKELVANITDLKVYIDERQVEYTATSTDDSWLLYFTYTHSIHYIMIIIPVFPSSPILPLFMILTLVAVVLTLVAVVFLMKKKGFGVS